MKKALPMLTGSLLLGVLAVAATKVENQNIVLSFQARGGAFPPVGEHVEAVCGKGATCMLTLNLLATGSPFAGEHDNVGIFRTRVPKNKILSRVKALQTSLRLLGTVKKLPMDAALVSVKVPGAEAAWIHGAEKSEESEERRKAFDDVLFHWKELRYMASPHPEQTARIGCQGALVGHEIHLSCVVENTGTKTIHLNGIVPKDIHLFSAATYAMVQVSEPRVFSSKMRQLAGLPPIEAGQAMTFNYQAKLLNDKLRKQQPVTISLNLVSEEFAGLLYSNRIQLK